MKKAVIVSLICILLIVSLNLIFAESIKITVKAVGEGGSDSPESESQMSLEEVTNNEGEQMQIQIQKENIAQIKTGGVSSEVSLKIVQEKEGEKTRLNAQLSNGKNIEIKIMPDTASEKAIGKLKIKNCNEENNCQIELKETGKGEEIKAVYEIRAQKQSKLFGFIKTKMRVMAQVNAENGEIERAEKSWWAFLASEPEETT